VDLDELARAYWAAPPYDEHDHSDGFAKHPFDEIQDLQLDGTDEQLAAMLRALALSATTPAQLASIGDQWIASLEYKFDAEGDTGKSLVLLRETGLDAETITAVLADFDRGWLRSMGAEQTLSGLV
jgi:hypothetical protein